MSWGFPRFGVNGAKEVKPLSEFDRTFFHKYGYDVYCHDCRIEIDKKYTSIVEKQCFLQICSILKLIANCYRPIRSIVSKMPVYQNIPPNQAFKSMTF